MRININLIVGKFLLLLILFTQKNIAQNKPFGDSLWTLAFSDEFNGTSVDANKWVGSLPWNQVGPSKVVVYNWNTFTFDTISNENYLAYTTRFFENVTVGGGHATIISKKQEYDGIVWERWAKTTNCWGNYYPDSVWCPVDSSVHYHYTTGMLYSKATFKYGYYEINIKMPDHSTNNDLKGIGPSFWMYGVENDTTLDWSEIDDFEFAGKYGNNYNVLTTNTHYRKCKPSRYPNSVSTGPSDTIHRYMYNTYPQSIIFNSQFHVLSFNWTPDKIDFYLDGVKYETLDSTKSNFLTAPSKLTNMPLIITVALPTLSFSTYQDIVNTVFPHNFEIDYVRVWQYKQYCDSNLNVCNFNAATYDPAIYNQVNVGGTGCNSPVSGGQNISFIGKEYVLLSEGFSVDANSTFLGDVKSCTQFFENARLGAPTIQPKPIPPSFIERMKLKINGQ